MASILISACPHDPSTKAGYHYLKIAAGILARHKHKVVLLRSAVLSKFHKALQDYDPDLVILNGHGGSKGVTGCGDNIILGVPSWDRDLGLKIERGNPEWMKGRIVYLFTCNAGKELAYQLLRNGAVAVAAYQEAFIFLCEEEDGLNREGHSFFDAALKLPFMLAGGFTFGEGCQAVRETFIEYRSEAEKRGDKMKAKYLHHDLVNFISLGNRHATLQGLSIYEVNAIR